MRSVFAITALLTLAASGVARELPPQAYKVMQAEAVEKLVIQVQKVKAVKRTLANGDVLNTVDVVAKVLKVTESKSLLKPKQTIRIHYLNRAYKVPIAGPSQIPILKTGTRCPAYLRKAHTKGLYAPVAGGYSFETVK